MSEVRRGPSVKQAWHDAVVKGRLNRIAKQEAQDAEDRRVAEATGTTIYVVRQQRAAIAATEAAHKRSLEAEAVRRHLRGGDPPTKYAIQMIPKIRTAYEALIRDNKRRAPSISATARRAVIDRDTISDWVRRGWMRWPPA